ncbi:MAG: tetratricopeptide repeat protein [Nitrospiraceae bacterium]
MSPSSADRASRQEIDRLATMLARDPRSKVFMPLAEEYGKVGMWQEAVGVLEDGLNVYPGFITAMVALGCAYQQVGARPKAKAMLEAAVKLSPENLRAHRTLAKIYAADGATEPALRSCAIILAVNPHNEEALSLQASLKGQGTAAVSSPSSSEGRMQSEGDVPVALDEPVGAAVAAHRNGLSASQSELPSSARKIAKLETWLEKILRARRSS